MKVLLRRYGPGDIAVTEVTKVSHLGYLAAWLVLGTESVGVERGETIVLVEVLDDAVDLSLRSIDVDGTADAEDCPLGAV